jgi:hypothetical protein
MTKIFSLNSISRKYFTEHIFINLFTNHQSVPGAVVGLGETVVNKTSFYSNGSFTKNLP